MEIQKQVCRHVVLFKFRDDLPETKVQEIETAFGDLCRGLPFVTGFEWGRNSSPENLNKGLTHCFLVTFANEHDRNVYLPHPAHLEFCDRYLEGNLEDVCVVDFLSRY